jgi:hypothetical protein
MIRRLNYTQRVRIRREDVSVTVRESDGNISFEADLSRLRGDHYDFPEKARVFLEAYRQTSWMRFDFGTIGALQPPANRSLNAFRDSKGILFRVKVTAPDESRRILAEARGIPLVREGEQKVPRRSLIYVRQVDLGDLVFKLEFPPESSDMPALIINSKLGPYTQLTEHPAFTALVYPTVFREILLHILLTRGFDEVEPDSESWEDLWLQFAATLPGMEEPPKCSPRDDDDALGRALDWVSGRVEAFARKYKALDRFQQFLSSKEGGS